MLLLSLFFVVAVVVIIVVMVNVVVVDVVVVVVVDIVVLRPQPRASEKKNRQIKIFHFSRLQSDLKKNHKELNYCRNLTRKMNYTLHDIFPWRNFAPDD